jgi:hypothetical protein
MPKAHTHWKVLPHGALTEVDEGIFTVTGELRMPLGSFPRRMVLVRLTGGRLLIFSAIALDSPGMAKLESHGTPAFLVVPSDMHRIDAHPFKERYPQIKVVTPSGARVKVAQVVLVDTTSPDFGDPAVTFVTVQGTEEHEFALVLHRPGGTTLVLNDIVGNIRDASGLTGWMLRLAGFAGDAPRVPRVVKKKLIDDTDALRLQLLQWSELPNLRRILVAHGEPVESNAAQTLRDLAQSL